MECCICFDTLDKNVAVLNCLHKYHKKCIENWFTYNLTKNKVKKRCCPTCGFEVYITTIINCNNKHKKTNKSKKITYKILEEKNKLCCSLL